MKSSFNGFIRSLAALALVISFSSAALADGVNVEWFTESVTQVGKALTAAGQSGASGASDYGTWTAQGTSAKLAEVLATDLEASPNKICVDTCETADGISLKYQPSTVLTDDKAIMYLNGVCFQNISALNDDDLEDAKAAVAIVKEGDAYKFAVAGYDSDESKVKWMTTEVTADRATSYNIKVEIDYENHTVKYYNGTSEIASKVLKSDAAKVASATVTGFGEFTGFLGEYVGAYEAMLGKVPYATFGAAYAVATSGVNTIALLKNVEWAPTYSTDLFKSVTVSNGNYSLTLAAASVTAYNEKGYLCKLDGSTLKLGLPFGGAGTEASPYTVSTAEALRLLANGVTSDSYGRSGEYFIQAANINLNNVAYPGIGGYDSHQFVGKYDGQGYTISGLVMTSRKYAGLFNGTQNSAIKNLVIELGAGDKVNGFDSGVDSPTGEYGLAALAGYLNASVVSNVTAKGAIYGTHNVAGIVIRSLGACEIVNCTNEAAVVCTYTKLAGILGMPYSGSIKMIGCCNKGTIRAYGPAINGEDPGNDGVAGIIAYVHPGCETVSIKDCSNSGAIVSDSGSKIGSNCPGSPTLSRIGTIIGCSDAKDHAKGKTYMVSGVNTAQDSILTLGVVYNHTQVAELSLATVDDGVATMPVTPEINGSYKVMGHLDSYTFNFTEPGTITFDRTLYTAFTPTIGKTRGGLRITEPAAGWTTGTWTAWNAPTVLIFN